jgi:hypothetical protein
LIIINSVTLIKMLVSMIRYQSNPMVYLTLVNRKSQILNLKPQTNPNPPKPLD